MLAGYGTGAIMAAPAQDQRDFEFAATYGLRSSAPESRRPALDGKGAYLGDGEAINSGFLNGLDVAQAKAKMIEWLEKSGAGERRVNYKLRDWLFSRQRYWGEPFPSCSSTPRPRQ